jgi:osmoprotectant transport system substrate-binding protein
MRKAIFTTVGVLSVLLTSGCALSSNGPGAAAGPTEDGPLNGTNLNVGSKDFTEQLLLCEITAQRLEAEGATVERTCGMSGSNAVRAALTSGSIDMYWEYTGTGWLTHLQQAEAIADPDALYQKLSTMDKSKNGVVWLPAASANNTYAIAAKSETAKDLGVSTISDYAKLAQTKPGSATFCGASEFFGRDDGWPGLQKAYGFQLPKEDVAELAEGPIYNAISKSNPCNFGEVFATDGRIASLGLTVLTDDKGYFPPYNLSLNVNEKVLSKNPDIKSAMSPVSELLTTTELQKLNAQIDVDGKTPEEVATTWLAANKLA